MTAPTPSLLAAADQVKAAVDAYVLGVTAVAADVLDPDDALDDERFTEPDSALFDALTALEDRAAAELGVPDEDADDDEDDEEADA